MARKQQLNNPYPDNDITVMGDSISAPESAAYYGNIPHQVWGKVLERKLRSRNCPVQCRIFARGGDTSAQFLGRASYINLYSTPRLGIIFGTPNDPVSGISGVAQAGTSNTITLDSSASQLQNSYVGNVISITSGTGNGQSKKIISYDHTNRIARVESNWVTTPVSGSGYTIAAPDAAQMKANHQALIKVFKFNVRGNGRRDSPVTLWSQEELPIGSPGNRYIILNDTSATGGLRKNHAKQHTNVLGDFSNSPKQSVWEYRTPRAGELGWGRVATNETQAFAEGCAMIMTSGPAYRNFPAGGDDYNVVTNIGTRDAGNQVARQAAQDAAIAEGTVFADVFSFQSMLVKGGQFMGADFVSETAQGSGDFHYIPTNQHLSPYGYDTVARAFEFYIGLQNNWIQNLSA